MIKMKVLGIIAEYNPFHNGHLYHLNKSLEITGATHSVAVMSGSFLQRGEPAVFNKWARAKMAVTSGIDLVIELPVVYSCQSAETFARGAISILDKTSSVDFLSFGSEAGDLKLLDYISAILFEEPDSFKEYLRFYLNKGLSFPAARSKALQRYDRALKGPSLAALNSPNNILALEYMKALRHLNSPIVPCSVKRIKAGYNSTTIRGTIASATAIRKALLTTRKHTCKLGRVIPESSMKILKAELMAERGPVHDDLFSSLIIGNLRKSKPEDIAEYPDVSEGLEYKIWNAARHNVNISELVKEIKSKRYTLTRLKRLMIYSLLDIRRDMVSRLRNNLFPGYVRVLAFNNKGRDILRKMKHNSSIPVITKTAVHGLEEGALPFLALEKDLLATDIYVMAYKNPKYSCAGQDFLTSPIWVGD